MEVDGRETFMGRKFKTLILLTFMTYRISRIVNNDVFEKMEPGYLESFVYLLFGFFTCCMQ
jgi:hypothetical protein